MFKRIIITLIAAYPCLAFPAEWQWSVPIPGQEETSCAFLWIPPACEKVRGIVIGQRNMLEEGIMEHPAFRANLARLGIAEVWMVPPSEMVFRFDQGAGERIESLMTALAEKSGYDELARAPLIPIGHSACASFPWNLAAWNPERTLAILSVKGDAPLSDMTGSGRPNPDWGDRNIDGIPGLMVMGEYEWVEGRLNPAETFIRNHPDTCFAMLACPGRGHFDISDDLIAFLNLFIQKSVDYRLTDDGPLRKLNPKEGWLVERWKPDQARTESPAPYSDYQGEKNHAFRAFDRETAYAIHQYREHQIGRKPQLIGVVSNGKVLDQSNTHFQIRLPHILLQDDGITFRIETTFMDHVGSGSDNLSRWARLPAGTPLTHATYGGPIHTDRICGPIQKIAPDTFRITLDRTWATTDRRNKEIWISAWHPGDQTHKSIVQQALMQLPENKEGKEQTIDFLRIPDITNDVISIPLTARSNANLPVRFFVKDGPAEVIGNRLYFTAIPPRTKYPVSVTIFAYQLGTRTEPKIQSAPMVSQTFMIFPSNSAENYCSGD